MALTGPGPTRAISIKQPWAGLVVSGVKRTENRVRPHPWLGAVGERLWLHASQTADVSALRLPQVRDGLVGLPAAAQHRGYVLGSARLVDVHRRAARCRCDPRWAEPDAWHLLFEDPVLLEGGPVRVQGALGLWRWGP